jgi:Bacterial PH domain
VLVGIVGTTVLGAILTARSGDLRWLFLSLPLAILLLVVGRFAPMGYRLAANGVHIERRAGARIIAYGSIRNVDRDARPLNGLAVLGSKGVFGRFGRFWNRRLGFYRLHVTDSEGVVWLSTDDGWVGLSPARPAEFVERLRSRLAILERGRKDP